MRAVNLIPSDERTSSVAIPTGRSGGGIFVVLGLVGGLAILALLYGLADRKISHNRTEVAVLAARAQQAQARAGALAPYTSFLQMREQRVQAVTALVNSRFDWAQAFRELGRVLPAGKVSLSSVNGTVGSGAASSSTSASAATSSSAAASSVTSATPPGSVPTFTLAGCATSQAEVALMLDRLRLIDGVNTVTLQSSTKSSSGGGGEGGNCGSGDPVFSAQIVFDALPAAPTSSTAGATSAVASSTAPAGNATPASSAPATTTPAAAPASTSPAGAVR
jgi:Tfp pilus assembly protein PilN